MNTSSNVDRIQDHLAAYQDEMRELLRRFALIESPSDDASSQDAMFALLRDELESVGMRARRFSGRQSGGCLMARPMRRERGRPVQLMLGHCDTVWPRQTLREMPVRIENGHMKGPGVYDMKCGLVQIVFALRALHELQIEPPLAPVVFINSDEEIGSPESVERIEQLARIARRAFVLEPSLGPSGRLKTARKGVGRFVVRILGKAAHAGLDPEAGASAILELSHVIQSLFSLNDLEQGTTVNVGVIDGGLRPNVVAPESRAHVDVRVLTAEEGARVEQAIRGLEPKTPNTRIVVEGSMRRPPMQRTAANQALWLQARDLGLRLGLDLEQGTAGGGSDGNFTSQHTATLDGLGAVGDGAHAVHEFVRLDQIHRRCALLALLLLAELPTAVSKRSP